MKPKIKKQKEKSEFPDWYTIDEQGLDSLNYFLLEEFKGETIKIIVEKETP